MTDGIRLDFRKTFLEINFLHLIRPDIIIQEFTLAHHKERRDQFHKQQGQGHLSQDEDRISGTIPMPTFARRPSTVSSLLPVEIPQNSLVGHQRQQTSELQFDKFPTLSTFLCWKIRFKNQVTTCYDFPSEVEMAGSFDELKSARSIAGKNFPNFETLDARIASALNKIIQNSHFKKKVSLEQQKAQKEDRFLRGRQIAHMN